MKKTLLFSIMMAAGITMQNTNAGDLSVVGEVQYATEHHVRGLNYSDDALGICVVGGLNLDWAYAFGGVHNVPRLGGGDSVNHTVLGLRRGVDAGAFSFEASVELQHHSAVTDSTEYGVGVTFESLPVVGKWADVGLTLWDNNDLDYQGVTVDITGKSIDLLGDWLSLTPYVEIGAMDNYDYYKLGSTFNFDWEDWRPYVNVYYLNSDDSPFGDEDGWSVGVGVRYSF